jgi:hypothetical protein
MERVTRWLSVVVLCAGALCSDAVTPALERGAQPTAAQWQRAEALSVRFAKEHGIKLGAYTRPVLVWQSNAEMDEAVPLRQEPEGKYGASARYCVGHNQITLCERAGPYDWLHEEFHAWGIECEHPRADHPTCERYMVWAVKHWSDR